MNHHEHPDAGWYNAAYRRGWLAYVEGRVMPSSEHALEDAGVRAGWAAAQRRYQADVISGEADPHEEATR